MSANDPGDTPNRKLGIESNFNFTAYSKSRRCADVDSLDDTAEVESILSSSCIFSLFSYM
ncbi:hypothetical protein D3C80_1229630 [compost metagenome]